MSEAESPEQEVPRVSLQQAARVVGMQMEAGAAAAVFYQQVLQVGEHELARRSTAIQLMGKHANEQAQCIKELAQLHDATGELLKLVDEGGDRDSAEFDVKLELVRKAHEDASRAAAAYRG